MTPQLPVRRYNVVQEKSQVEDEIVNAIRDYRDAELDLVAESGILHVAFRINTTTHDDEESLIIGTTVTHQTINLYIERNGEVFALLPN